MIQKQAKFTCGCEVIITYSPNDEFEWFCCLEHGSPEIDYINSLRKEICNANIAYALTSSDPAVRLLAEEIVKSELNL